MQIAREWGLNVAQARYSSWGNWYAPVTRFPAALLDAEGYIIFPDEASLRANKKIKITRQINVPSRISSLQGYVKVAGLIPEELPHSQRIVEGAKLKITVNRYERNAAGRKACLEHYGYACSVCDITLKTIYGERAERLIHVHHLIPLSEIGSEYVLDPIKDLRPVCPNCHAFLHTTSPPITIPEAKKILKNLSGNQAKSDGIKQAST